MRVRRRFRRFGGDVAAWLRPKERLPWYEYSDLIDQLQREGRHREAAAVARRALERAEREFGHSCPYVGWQLGRLTKILTHLAKEPRQEVRVPPEFAVAA